MTRNLYANKTRVVLNSFHVKHKREDSLGQQYLIQTYSQETKEIHYRNDLLRINISSEGRLVLEMWIIQSQDAPSSQVELS